MKNIMIARGYAGLQALMPTMKPRKSHSVNVQEITPVNAVFVASGSDVETGRVRVLAKRNARFARRLARAA